MKLIVAIVNKEDSKIVNSQLINSGFTVTRLSTTGGFLMAGNVTMLIGTEVDRIDECIEIISTHSRQRQEVVPSTASYGVGVSNSFPLEVAVGGATIFVLDVERFEKL